ncbi:MAG: hypothetical protein C0469_17545 [Cyanobacteria bacterium DS2.3.42]|nr:hypothetical protein [Cyanobacteria bacterium DS2.3.42]
MYELRREIQPMPSHAVERPAGVEITAEETARLLTERAAAERAAAPALPPLSIDAVNYAQKNFGRMDGNGDGHVDDYELDGYIKANEKKMSKEESALVHQIKDHRDDLEEASNDETGDENDGFTRQDLALTKRNIPASTTGESATVESGGDLRPALDYANKNFNKLDSDKDGFINNDEIGKYMAENELSSTDVGLLRDLKDRSQTVSNGSADGDGPMNSKGISKKDLAATNDQINNLTFAAENFTAMDANGNGHVTKEEIIGYERARNDLSGTELRALDALKNQVDKLDDLHNDETGDENSGYTGYDILDGMTALGSPDARTMRKLAEPAAEVATTTAPPATPPEAVTPPEAGTPPGATDAVAQERTHTVASGETLWRICADELRSRNGGSRPSNSDVLSAIRAVENANPNLDRERIKPGQEIKIPVDLNGPAVAEREPDPSGRRRPVPRPTPLPRDPGESRLPPNERPNPPREPGDPIPPRSETPKPEPEKSDPEVLRENWRAIDRSGDNRVSREEIQDFVRNNQRNLTMKEISALGRMAAREGKIQELVNDERGDENSGMSMADVRKAEQLQAAAQYLLRRDVMDNLNVNGDRFVDKRELEYALRTQNMRPQDRAMLNFLRSNYAKFQEGANNERGDENSGVSIQDLQYYAGLV